LLDSTKIRREIARLYDKDPQDWRVLVGKDRAGFYDVLISKGNKGWQMKEYQVNPYKFVGVGSRIPYVAASSLTSGEYPFGLRPIDLSGVKELASVIDDPKTMSDLASRFLNEKPVSFREAIESPAILQGPILQSSSPLEPLSTAHTRLDERLRKELQRIVNKEFRHTVTPYI
jgi:hypothetical protein